MENNSNYTLDSTAFYLQRFFHILLFKCQWLSLEQLMTIFYFFLYLNLFFLWWWIPCFSSLIMDKTSYDFLKILTVNCQGLGEYKKRSDVLNYLKDKNHNIYFLQDTHFTCDEEQNIQIFWGGKIYFGSFRSNSRGVAILFKK